MTRGFDPPPGFQPATTTPSTSPAPIRSVSPTRWARLAVRWRTEWLVVLVLPLLLAAAMWARGAASLLRSLRDWLGMSAATDSWYPMERALDLMRQPGGRVYEKLFFGEGVKFQYPPSSLILHEVAARLGLPLTADGLNEFNWLLVWVYAGLCGLFAARMAARARLDGRPGMPHALVGVLAGCAALLCYPVLKAFTLGQVQLWIDVAFVAACLAWLANRKFACGALLGAVCLIKPQFSLFLLWGALRLEWRFVAGWAAVAGAGVAVSLALFGPQNHLDYLQVLHALASTGEAYYPNQSVNGILNRLLGTAPATVWNPNGFPPYHPLVRVGTLATSVLLIAGVLLYRRKQPSHLLDLQAAALAFTMASPIAWEHHYGILPPILAALYVAIAGLDDRARVRTGYLVLGACYLLSFSQLGLAHRADAGPMTLLHSYLFAAGLCVLWLLFDTAHRTAWLPAAASTPPVRA